MAPQLKAVSAFVATLALLVVSAQAEALTVQAVVAFNDHVPSVGASPGLGGFKDRFKKAYEDALNYINDLHQTNPGQVAPSLKDTAPDWSYSDTTATAVFPYTVDWEAAVRYLVAEPALLYYYDNDTSSSGYKLIHIYDCDPQETSFDNLVASPPPSPILFSPPPPSPETSPSPSPSPPPPIFARSPPSPKPPPPPPKPSPPSPPPRPPPNNMTVVSQMFSTEIPLESDVDNYTYFQNTYYETYANMIACLEKYGKTYFAGMVDASSYNGTLVTELCYPNGSFAFNVTTKGNITYVGGIPSTPTGSNWTQSIINFNDTDLTAPGVQTRRRRNLLQVNRNLLQVNRNLLQVKQSPRPPKPPPSPPKPPGPSTVELGKAINSTATVFYDNVTSAEIRIVQSYSYVLVNGQVTLMLTILKYVNMIMKQTAYYYLDGNSGSTNTSTGYKNVAASRRRRLIARKTASNAVSGTDLSAVKWDEVDPSDVAYGTDKSLYEIFSTPADYYTAGSACSARGAKLASYVSEGAQIFIDILCDGTTGMQCWVEGNDNGVCSSVSSSLLHDSSCGKRMPFVCVKDKQQAVQVQEVTAWASDIAEEKPSDVAYDTHKTLYELFVTPVNYHTAGSVCLARGGRLANYGSEAAQVFIDVLCEAAVGHTCWVEGNTAGACSAVHASDVVHTPCTKLQPFVCTKAPQALTKAL